MNRQQAIKYILDNLKVLDFRVYNDILAGKQGTFKSGTGRSYTYDEIRRKAEQFMFLMNSHTK